MPMFVILNETISDSSEINVSQLVLNQRFRIEKKTWYGYTLIPFLNKNIDEIVNVTERLNLKLPAFFNNRNELFRLIKRMLHKNKLYRSGLVSIQLFWHNQNFTSLISAIPSVEFDFPVSKSGILMNFSEISVDEKNPLNQFQFFHHQFWSISEQLVKKTNWHNSVILNRKGMICEAIGSNIYLALKGKIYTPSIHSGCCENPIRSLVIRLLEQIGVEVLETDDIPEDIVFQADEVFLVSEEKGIQWVMGIESKRFLRQYCFELHREINAYMKNLAESVQ